MAFDYPKYEKWVEDYGGLSFDSISTAEEFERKVQALADKPGSESIDKFHSVQGEKMFKRYFGFDVGGTFDEEKLKATGYDTKAKARWEDLTKEAERSLFEQKLEEINASKDPAEAMKLLGDIKQREGDFRDYTSKEREAALKLLKSTQGYKDIKEGFTSARRTRLEGFELPKDYVDVDRWKKTIGEERIELKGDNVRVKGLEELSTDEILGWRENRIAAIEKEAAGIPLRAEREREREKGLRFLNNQLREAGYPASDLRREEKEREIVEIEGRFVRTKSRKAKEILDEQKDAYKEKYGIYPPSKRNL